jgi:hypothetical protein
LCDTNPRGCAAFIVAEPILGGLGGYLGGHDETFIDDIVVYQAP